MAEKGTYQPPDGAYPPQYPPQAEYTGYNPPPPGYGYNPAQPGYNPPAPAYYPQAGAQQQATNTVIVVQPKPTVTTTVVTPVGDYYYTASIVLSFICFFCGSWWALCCTIPAIFVASSAREAAARGDREGARRSGQMALGLNIAGVVSYVVLWILIIGVAAGTRRTCYYNTYTGYYSYCY